LLKIKRITNVDSGVDSPLSLLALGEQQINIVEIERMIEEMLNVLQCYDSENPLLHESLAMITTSFSGILGNLLYLVRKNQTHISTIFSFFSLTFFLR
jgi:hypothetical protein